MNLQKMLLIAMLAAAVSVTTIPTLGKVLGFCHTAAYAGDDNSQGDSGAQGEYGDVDGQ